MRTVVSLIALTTFATAAPVPKALQKVPDENLLTGEWQIVTCDTGNGQQAPAGDFANFRFKYADGVLNTGTPSSPGWVKVKLTLDPTANPRVMLLETSPERVIKNVYRIDGDTLYWCEWQKADAPDSFDGGGGRNSFVLKRVMSK
jgi:uncharacterized protein (TIGR03067 family)